MTADRFDRITQQLDTTHSRRTVLGRMAATVGIVAGALALSAGSVSAARGVTPACARLHQSCASTVCCPGLTCGDDATCCVAEGVNCIQDADCCGDNVCVAKPSGLGHICAPAA